MRIVFMGSPAEVISPFEQLLDFCDKSNQHQVIAIVSQPAKPAGRKRQLQDPPLAQFAKERGLKVFQPVKARDLVFLDQLKALEPDLMITAAYGQILSDAFLAIPKRGTINIHPSLLPELRGATPVQSSLLHGFNRTGVSILFTVKELDAGPIITQEQTPIAADERAGELMSRLFKLGGTLLIQSIKRLEDPNFQGYPQDVDRVTHCSKIEKEDGKIDWHAPHESIFHRFRAFHPWPGSFTYLDGKRIVVDQMSLLQGNHDSLDQELDQHPGSFIYDKPQRALAVRSKDGILLIKSLKPEGSKELDANAFINGLKGIKKGCFS